MLTGPPRVGATVMPYAAAVSPVVETQEDRSRYKSMGNGQVRLAGTKRLARRFTFGFRGMSEASFEALVAELVKPNFLFTPRTAKVSAGESAAQEELIYVRCVSPIPETRPIGQDGYDVDVELESTALYGQVGTVIPDVGAGGGAGGTFDGIMHSDLIFSSGDVASPHEIQWQGLGRLAATVAGRLDVLSSAGAKNAWIGVGGIQYDRGGNPAARMYWDDAAGRWKAGTVGAEYNVALNDSTLQAGLNSDLLDSYHAVDFARKAEDATISGSWTVTPGTLSFGSTTRQMLNLYGTRYALGIQSGTLYFRTEVEFDFYLGGVHSNTQGAPGTGGSTLMRLSASIFTYQGSTIWHAGNDGSGSGLDADLLDGINSTAFGQKALAETITGLWRFDGGVMIDTADATNPLYVARTGSTTQEYMRHTFSDQVASIEYVNDEADSMLRLYVQSLDTPGGGVNASTTYLQIRTTSSGPSLQLGTSKVWWEGNDGSGSGLDADLLDGINSTAFAQKALNETITGGWLFSRANVNTTFDSGSANDARLEFKYNGVRKALLGWDSLSFSVSTDSGVQLSLLSPSVILAAISGAEKYRVTSNGLGVNGAAADATYALSVTGGVRGSTSALLGGSGVTGRYQINRPTDGALGWWAGYASGASNDVTLTQASAGGNVFFSTNSTGGSQAERARINEFGLGVLGAAATSTRALMVGGSAEASGDIVTTGATRSFVFGTYAAGLRMQDAAWIRTYDTPSTVGLMVPGENGIQVTRKIATSNSASGPFGSGFVFWRDAVTGQSYGEMDNLFIRSTLRTHIFQKDIIRVTNGYLFISDAAELTEDVTAPGVLDAAFTIYTKEGTLQPRDLIWYKDVDDNTGSIFSARFEIRAAANGGTPTLVTRNGQSVYSQQAVIREGMGTILRRGGTLARIGNTSDPARDGALYFQGTGQLFFDVYDGITSFTAFQDVAYVKVRLGDLTGISDTINGTAVSGWGLYSSNAFLKGGIVASYGKIGSWSIGANYLTNSTVTLGNNLSTQYAAGGLFIGLDNVSTNPELRVVGPATTDYVRIFFNGSTNTWGLRGINGSAVVFSFGDTNLIAGTKFSGSGMWNGSASSIPAIGDSATNYILTSTGTMSLKDKLVWNGTLLSITGAVNITGGTAFTGVWNRAYSVTTAAPLSLTDENGAALDTAYTYLAEAVTTGTGTQTYAKVYFYYNGTAWQSLAVFEKGTNSNHPRLYVPSGGVPTVTLYSHASTYGVSVRMARLSRTDDLTGIGAGFESTALPATPSGSGLFLGSDYMGYYSSGTWRSYIKNDGTGQLASGNLTWDASGNLNITGVITALVGGSIGGWGITSGTSAGITRGGVGVSVGMLSIATSGALSFFAGANDTAGTAAKFSVTNTGSLIAALGTIGGVNLTTDGLHVNHGAAAYSGIYRGPGSMVPAARVFFAGATTATGANALFDVKGNGSMSASAGDIAGWSFDSTKFQASYLTTYVGMQKPADASTRVFFGGASDPIGTGASFYVQTNGLLKATNADITGTVTATSGYIGTSSAGWTINSNGLEYGSAPFSMGLIRGATSDDIWLYGGGSSASTAAFRVKRTGQAYFAGILLGPDVNGTRDGLHINSNNYWYVDGTPIFKVGDATTYVDWNGSILTVKGVIQATGGSAGGWDISSTVIQSANDRITLDSVNEVIRVGTQGGGSYWTEYGYWAGEGYGMKVIYNYSTDLIKIGTFTMGGAGDGYTPTVVTPFTQPSFEAVGGWTFTGGATRANIAGHAGAWLGRITGVGGGMITQTVDLTAYRGKTVRIRFWLNAPNGATGNARFNQTNHVQIWDLVNTTFPKSIPYALYLDTVDLPFNTWVQFDAHINVPSNGGNFQLRISASGQTLNGGTGATLYVDDITVSVFDQTRTTITPDGLWIFNSPVNQLKITPAETILRGLNVQTNALFCDSTVGEPSPISGLSAGAFFFSGSVPKVMLPDGTTRTIQTV